MSNTEEPPLSACSIPEERSLFNIKLPVFDDVQSQTPSALGKFHPNHKMSRSNFGVKPFRVQGDSTSVIDSDLEIFFDYNKDGPTENTSVKNQSRGSISSATVAKRSPKKGNSQQPTFQLNQVQPGEDQLDIFNVQSEEAKNKCQGLEVILDNALTHAIILLITIYVLFIDDLRSLTMPKSCDNGIDISLFVCVGVYLVEIVLAFIARPEYRWNFFFWLDLFSTFTIVFDTNIFQGVAFHGGSEYNSAQISRAGRLSRVGIRIARIIRILRLIRIAKLFKQVSEHKQKAEKKEKDVIRQEIEYKVQCRLSFMRGSSINNIDKKLEELDRQSSLQNNRANTPHRLSLFANNMQSSRINSVGNINPQSSPNIASQRKNSLQSSKKSVKIVTRPSMKPLLNETLKQTQQDEQLDAWGKLQLLQTKLGVDQGNPEHPEHLKSITENDSKVHSVKPSLKTLKDQSLNSEGDSEEVSESKSISKSPANSFSKIPMDIKLEESEKKESEKLKNSTIRHREEETKKPGSERSVMTRSKKFESLRSLKSLRSIDHRRSGDIRRSQSSLDDRRLDRKISRNHITRQNSSIILGESKGLGDELESHDQNDEEYNFVPPEEIPKESRVARALAERTTKRVLIVVMLTLLLLPMAEVSFWEDPDESYTYDIQNLDLIISTMQNATDYVPVYNLSIQHFLTDQINQPVIPLVFFQDQNGNVLYQDPILDELRSAEIDTVSGTNNTNLTATFSQRNVVHLDSLLSIIRTIFICAVFIIGSLLFTKDAEEQVLAPLERMISKVNKIARNQLTQSQDLINQEEEPGVVNETAFLENAITKIVALLALGYGEAGSQIITQNIIQTGDVEPMVDGSKILAIFGFCDIRNFTDVTEVLQEDVMVFVNSIAKIVHGMSDRYLGQANKNIGDAFLLVWKFPLSEIYVQDDDTLTLVRSDYVVNLADLAVITFLRVMAAIYTSPVMKKYRENAKILKRIPKYTVKMGFGLDQGWAIEGAIGSEFKIDASYLSPHVNLSSRMEAATKQYGVPFLISGNIHNILSDATREYCRKIDCVTVKGSKNPIDIYTIDVDLERLEGLKPKHVVNIPKKSKLRKRQEKKRTLYEGILQGTISASKLFETKKDLKLMVLKDSKFKELWDKGMDAYISGDWPAAETLMNKARSMRHNDGPSKTLIEYMKERGFAAPNGWKGYRELSEK